MHWSQTQDGIVPSPPLKHRKEIWPLCHLRMFEGSQIGAFVIFKKSYSKITFLLSRNLTCKMLAVFHLLATLENHFVILRIQVILSRSFQRQPAALCMQSAQKVSPPVNVCCASSQNMVWKFRSISTSLNFPTLILEKNFFFAFC